MAKSIGPLGSNSAHGKIGPLVFQTSRFGQQIHIHTPQRVEATESQLAQRYKFGITADAWRGLSDEEKESWNVQARGLKMTGFNLYIKENIPD